MRVDVTEQFPFLVTKLGGTTTTEYRSDMGQDMNVPKFNAESSFYKTSYSYYSVDYHRQVNQGICLANTVYNRCTWLAFCCREYHEPWCCKEFGGRCRLL